MILQALDTIHVSAVSSDNIITGQVFEIHDLAGKSLIERGLAVEINEPVADPAGPIAQAEPDLSDNAAGAHMTLATPIAKKAGANTRTKAA